MSAKRFLCTPMILLLLALTACGSQSGTSDDELALRIRTEYLAMQTLEASMDVTADYGERVYEYSMDATWSRDGEFVLSITAPPEVAGMTAKISAGDTFLVFEESQLETGPLSAGGLSPIDCFPAILDYAQNGYIAECGSEPLGETECLRIQYRDPEVTKGTGSEATLWFSKEDHKLQRAELTQDGFTVIQVGIHSFTSSES